MLIAEVFKQEKKSVRKPYVSNNEEWLNKQNYIIQGLENYTTHSE